MTEVSRIEYIVKDAVGDAVDWFENGLRHDKEMRERALYFAKEQHEKTGERHTVEQVVSYYDDTKEIAAFPAGEDGEDDDD